MMSILAAIISFFTRIILARELGPKDYGLFYAVYTLIFFFLFFRDLGVNAALVKYIPEFKVKKKFNAIKTSIVSVIIMQVISSTVLITGFLIASNYLVKNYFKNPDSKVIIILLLLYVVGSIFFRLYKRVFQGLQKIKLYALFEPLKNITFLLLTLLFFRMNLGVYAPALAYAILCFLLVIIFTPVLLKNFNFFSYKVKNTGKITKLLLMFGLPLFATAIGGKFISNIDTLILTNFANLTAVGIYNVILPSASLFLYFGSAISSVMFPLVSELWAKKDKKTISTSISLIHRYSFLIILPPALIILSFAKLFIEVFFGIDYISGAVALQILIIGMLFYVVAGINHNIISAIGRPQTVAKIIISAAILNTVANIILIPRFGINGAAISTTLSYILALILSTNRVLYYVKAEFPKKIWLKLFFAGAVFISVILIITQSLLLNIWLEAIIAISVAGLIYLVMVYYMNVIDIDEIKKHIKLLRRN